MQVIDRVVEFVIAALMAVLLVLVFCAVVFRYLIGAPIAWSEELGRFCLVWVSFLGTYLAHRRVEHIAVTVISDRLPEAARFIVALSLGLLLLGFLMTLVWFGLTYSLRFMGSTTPLLQIPLGAVYFAMPICIGLTAMNVMLGLISLTWNRFSAFRQWESK